jgi:hypothetical protein
MREAVCICRLIRHRSDGQRLGDEQLAGHRQGAITAGDRLSKLAQRPQWTRCSVIPGGLLIRQGYLAGFDMNAAIKRIRKRLERSKIHGRIVLGGLDVSLNVEANVITGWQFHIYLIVEGKNDAALQKAIKDALPPEPTALEPYDFLEVSDPLRAVTYL